MESSSSQPDRLRHLVARLAHLLPAQGPIHIFIHHNTLHAFQHLPFEQAVLDAATLFGREPYMSESAYRQAFDNGRIRLEDVESILVAEGSGEELPGGLTAAWLRRLMLLPGVRTFCPETISWEIEENGLLDSFRRDIPALASLALERDVPRRLFQQCLWYAAAPPETQRTPARVRDGLLHHGTDLDDAVHPLLIKLSAAFLDQGLAYWPMPGREQGFWAAALSVLAQPFSISHPAFASLPKWIRMLEGRDSTAAVLLLLKTLGIDEPGWQRALEAELLALAGWAGLFHQLECDPALAPHERVPSSLMDFLAVRMLLTAAAAESVDSDTATWKRGPGSADDSQARRLAEAATFFDAAQLAGLTSEVLASLDPIQARRFFDTVRGFGSWQRRAVFHRAYERRHERRILLPLAQYRRQRPLAVHDRLAGQVFFCIDEREESIRRHLEEVDRDIETLGAPGFFGVAMNYTGIDDAHGVALCPVVVKPEHRIEERPAEGHHEAWYRRRALRKAWARGARGSFVASRTLVRGWLGTALLGVFSLWPLAARVLSPRQYSRLVQWLNDSVLPEPKTELAFMRNDRAGHDAADGLLNGFSVAEKVQRVASVLRPAGLHKALARLVVVLGHGSTSLNNPHESAHDCGACGGRRGGPNARLFAAMANHPGVRLGLREHNIWIPEDTWFVGGYHDTCSDDIQFFDLESLPGTHAGDLARIRASLDQARARSALERARRFEAAGRCADAGAGLRHVQERSEHLAEPRPEYGHCTNSVCVVGRRAVTRGLFLDRRAFLVSYDATVDPDGESLARLLGTVIPVCAGISLEYYFSFVDNEGYGCGTKLPHNVTGLVGVMNGYESDLRTGLPWQMVEIHEPVRILFVIEAKPEVVLETIRKNPLLWEFLSNQWIRVAAMDPHDGNLIHMYRGNGQWERVEGRDEALGQAPSSLDWYRGKTQHLGVARIEAEAAAR